MPVDSNGREIGWMPKWGFQTDSLAADSIGRQAMADGFIQNAKIDTGTITASKFAAKALMSGIYGFSTYGAAFYG